MFIKKLIICYSCFVCLSFAQTNYARMLNGVNYQTGTTYTFTSADGLRVTQFNNANPVSVTLPNGSTVGFQAGAIISAVNNGIGTVTITCSACTINGSLTFALATGQSVDIYSDGLNYVGNKGAGGGGGGATLSPLIQTSTQAGSTSDVRISNAITTLSGTGVVWANDSTAQTWTACPTFGAGNVRLVLFPVTYSIAANCTVPPNVTIELQTGAALSPATGTTTTVKGPLVAAPIKIFANALVGQGAVDFTGNTNQFDVYPEWWGAVAGGSAATNTTAMQAAFYGAFGCNTSPATTCRTNASGFTIYNKRLRLTGTYQITTQLAFYHVLGFTIDCSGNGQLASGLVQTGTNQKILDGQSDAYGVFIGCSWSTTASQDLNHPLIDLNFDGSQGVDLKPQFINFYHNVWSGGQLAKIGFRLAAAGGGAQGSNINFYNNLAQSFTEAAYMIGAGSGCTATTLATNAISVLWYGGDMQGNFAYGIEDFGGTNIEWDGGTAENGSDIALGGTNQTGADFCATSLNAGGGPFAIKNMRSESQVVMTGSGPWALYNVRSADDILVPGPGNTPQVGDLIEGSVPCSHGLWNKITGSSGVFSGLGTVASPRSTTSGTATTLVDSVGGLTVNAWTGFNICIQAGTGVNQYATITSNTATTFTFTGGLKTDFPTNGIVAPDNTTTYTVEPNWGTATTDGGATFAIDNTTYSGVAVADTVFFPGKRMKGAPGARFSNVQLTRADWAGTGVVDQIAVPDLTHIDVGSPVTTGSGNAQIGLGQNFPLIRTYTLPRNSLTEQSFFLREEIGTRTLHWWGGQAGGGTSTIDIYTGADSNLPTTNAGDWFISNNSSNTPQKWTFNSNGTANFPAAIIGSGTTSGACANPNNGYVLIGGSSNNTNITSFGSNGIDFCANGSRVATVFSTAFAIDGTANIGYNGGKGQHFVTFASNSDMAGVCSGTTTTCSVTFTTAYGSTPSCVITPTTAGVTSAIITTQSASGFTVTYAPSASTNFNYICIGNPN